MSKLSNNEKLNAQNQSFEKKTCNFSGKAFLPSPSSSFLLASRIRATQVTPAETPKTTNDFRPQENSDTFYRHLRIKAAVLGATGLVGQYFVRLLTNHPFYELTLLTSSDRNAGKEFRQLALPNLFPEHGQEFSEKLFPDSIFSLQLQPTHHDLIKPIRDLGVEVVFSALPSGVAGPIEAGLREEGLALFTNSSSHRMDEDVPILIPEVNADHLILVKKQKEKYRGFIVAGSNCCVAGLVLSLKPLLNWGIKKVQITTFQSISGAGRSGLSAYDITDNLIPFINNEEEKISNETTKILGFLLGENIVRSTFEVSASCVRVPLRQGHLLEIEVEFQMVPAIEDVVRVLSGFKSPESFNLPTAPQEAIILRPEPDRPQPAFDLWAGHPDRARGMAISVGRLRLNNNSLRFFALTNNLVRGAAGNCLLAAELAYRLGYLGKSY